ncbi:MAG: hypothetical protein ACK47M_03470, partial [Caldilinea sp.]
MIVDFSVLFDRLGEQFTLLLIMLEREAVQRQIATMLAILLFTWLAPHILDRVLRRLARKALPEPLQKDEKVVGVPSQATDASAEDASSADDESSPTLR